MASEIKGTFKGVISKGREKYDASAETNKAKANAMESRAYELKRQKEIEVERKAEEKRIRDERRARYSRK